MPRWRHVEPALQFARPDQLRDLLFQAFCAVAFERQHNEAQVPQNTAKPPGQQRATLAAERQRVNPRAVFRRRGRLQLVEHRRFEPVGEITLAFQLAEKILHHVAFNDDDDDRLQFARRGFNGRCRTRCRRQNVDCPDDLRHRHGRQFFQLQLHHRERFAEAALRQFDDTQKNIFRRQPRDVQPGLPQGSPGFGDQAGRQRLACCAAMFAVQRAAFAGVELPEAVRVGRGLQDVAGMPAGHGLIVNCEL